MSSSTVKYVTRDQVFTMTLSGLMPLTVHYVYMDNNLIASSKIKPQGGSLGDALKTDQNGQVTFNFYYNGGLMADSTPWAESEKIQANLAASKKIVVASKSTATLDIDYTSTYLSYASITIKVDVATSTSFIPTAAIYQTVEVPGPVVTQERAPPPAPPAPPEVRSGGGGCPAPWIQILLEDGTTVAASNLKVGDKVWTQHETTIEWGAFEVSDHQIISDVERWRVELHTGEVFVGTYNHRVKTVNGWLEINDLQRGMEIITPTETALVLSSKFYDRGDVVLITVSDAHTYISSGVLSHNIKMIDGEHRGGSGGRE